MRKYLDDQKENRLSSYWNPNSRYVKAKLFLHIARILTIVNHRMSHVFTILLLGTPSARHLLESSLVLLVTFLRRLDRWYAKYSCYSPNSPPFELRHSVTLGGTVATWRLVEWHRWSSGLFFLFSYSACVVLVDHFCPSFVPQPIYLKIKGFTSFIGITWAFDYTNSI